MFTLISLALLINPLNTHAKDHKEHKVPAECQPIVDACNNAGFKLGDWKKGDGTFRDCIDPIMQGKTTVPGATKPLPSVDANAIATCKAKHPKFGQGKVGS